MARTGTSTGGGNGGNGGSGGTASATILGTVILNGSAGVGQTSGQAVLVQANGGGGGEGGSSGSGIGQAGGGGFAGAGGGATLTLGNATTHGILKASGNFGHGAVVQSVGGGGGQGGSAGFFGEGGAGAAGGDGGQVTVNAPKPSVVRTRARIRLRCWRKASVAAVGLEVTPPVSPSAAASQSAAMVGWAAMAAWSR